MLLSKMKLIKNSLNFGIILFVPMNLQIKKKFTYKKRKESLVFNQANRRSCAAGITITLSINLPKKTKMF